MASDVSIAFKASDGLTAELTKMKSSVSDMSNTVESYRTIQEKAFGAKVEVKYDITQAKTELKELSALIKSGDEEAVTSYKEKQLEIEKMTEEYRRLTTAAKDAYQAERDLQTSESRSSNSTTSGVGSTISTLASTLLLSTLGNSVVEAATSGISSMYGSTTGDVINSVLSSAVTGAVAGSLVPVVGTAIGAAVGGVSGLVTGLAEKQTGLDDLFRTEVESLYSTVLEEDATRLSTSSTSAAERELTLKGYQNKFGEEEGTAIFDEIKEYGTDTPYAVSDMLSAGDLMASYGIADDQIVSTMQLLGDITGGSTDRFNSLSYAYAQIQSAGKLNAQDKNQMTSAGFNPLEFIAKDWDMTLAEVTEKMSAGEITSDDVTRAMELATSEGERYYQNAEGLMDTYSGQLSMLNDVKSEIELSMGEAYNATRKEGIINEIDIYSGETGEKMREAYDMIGSYEAEMENMYEQGVAQAIQDVFETAAYKEAELAGDSLEMKRLMWEAQTNAEIAYKNSEEYQLKLAAEKDMVENIQSALTTDGDYVKFGEAMAEQFSLGWSGGVQNVITSSVASAAQVDEAVTESGSWLQQALKSNTEWAERNGYLTSGNGYATGINRVPYDNMPALLHEGERVLTRVEAGQYDKGYGGIQIAKIADSVIIREDADIDKIAKAFVEKLQIAAGGYVGA